MAFLHGLVGEELCTTVHASLAYTACVVSSDDKSEKSKFNIVQFAHQIIPYVYHGIHCNRLEQFTACWNLLQEICGPKVTRIGTARYSVGGKLQDSVWNELCWVSLAGYAAATLYTGQSLDCVADGYPVLGKPHVTRRLTLQQLWSSAGWPGYRNFTLAAGGWRNFLNVVHNLPND